MIIVGYEIEDFTLLDVGYILSESKGTQFKMNTITVYKYMNT